MSKPDTPAFPEAGLSGLPNGEFIHGQAGMSLRQYAAIHLRVPDSGEVWLDEMIERSRNLEIEIHTASALRVHDILRRKP